MSSRGNPLSEGALANGLASLAEPAGALERRTSTPDPTSRRLAIESAPWEYGRSPREGGPDVFPRAMVGRSLRRDPHLLRSPLPVSRPAENLGSVWRTTRRDACGAPLPRRCDRACGWRADCARTLRRAGGFREQRRDGGRVLHGSPAHGFHPHREPWRARHHELLVLSAGGGKGSGHLEPHVLGHGPRGSGIGSPGARRKTTRGRPAQDRATRFRRGAGPQDLDLPLLDLEGTLSGATEPLSSDPMK